MAARAYLDFNATAPLRAQARAAMMAALDMVGNPSSVHAEGRLARRLVEEARQDVADLLGANPRHVVFTSGGTEANTFALCPWIEVAGDHHPRDRLWVSAIEHPSVRCGGSFPSDKVQELDVSVSGVIDLEVLEYRLSVGASAGGRPLVSIMLANNESGIIQPIQAAARVVHAMGGLLHVDAVQAAGRIACSIADLDADLLTVSAHKLGGPKGVGALVRREGVVPRAVIRGGGQERGLRAGTENVAAIAGFGAAAAVARDRMIDEAVCMRALRDRLEAGLRAISSDITIFGADVERLPNTVLFAVPGVKAETAVIALDLEGIAVSSGAACSSGKVQPSHVLAAMGVDPLLARGAIRVSLGPQTTEIEVDCFLHAWTKLGKGLNKGVGGLAA
jgi:cysteine desulfurase